MDDRMVEDAYIAKQKSEPHISGYKVGASIKTDQGVFTGCNMETMIHTGSIHAEIHATAKALFEGATEAYSLCVVVEDRPFYPCGMCRQVLYEKWGGSLVVCAKADTDGGFAALEEKTLRELLPGGFRVED